MSKKGNKSRQAEVTFHGGSIDSVVDSWMSGLSPNDDVNQAEEHHLLVSGDSRGGLGYRKKQTNLLNAGAGIGEAKRNATLSDLITKSITLKNKYRDLVKKKKLAALSEKDMDTRETEDQQMSSRTSISSDKSKIVVVAQQKKKVFKQQEPETDEKHRKRMRERDANETEPGHTNNESAIEPKPKRKRTKTRSRQKNIRKDNRPEELKPLHLRRTK